MTEKTTTLKPYKRKPFKETGRLGDHTRSGIYTTRRGPVLTPTFMPDGTRGVVKSLMAEQVAATGVQIVLANTYHLHVAPGERVIRELGGVHGFGKWQGPILTDSGGFQAYSLSHTRKITEEGVVFKEPRTGDTYLLTPEKSMQIQLELGSDIFVAFDDLTGLDEADRHRTKEAFERTHRWLERCIKEFARLTADMPEVERPQLFGVVQGGLDKSLRLKSLETVQSSGVDGIAIGGLSVGEPREDMWRVLEWLAPHYDSDRPRFLLGVGDPRDVRHGIEYGIDMFDCVLPTRNARHATVWVADELSDGSEKSSKGSDGSSSGAGLVAGTVAGPVAGTPLTHRTLHLTNAAYEADPSVIDPTCDCYTCASGYSKGFLRHQFKVGEPLAGSLASIHNLRFLSRMCEGYRSSR